jgi:hypothetical protein
MNYSFGLKSADVDGGSLVVGSLSYSKIYNFIDGVFYPIFQTESSNTVHYLLNLGVGVNLASIDNKLYLIYCGDLPSLTTSTTSGNTLVDGTSRLTKDGNITWNLKTFKNLWKPQILQVNASPQYTQNLYWIRISLNAISIAPTAKAIGNHGVDRIAIYSQSGDITPTFSVDALGRVGFLPAELETKYTLGTLSGLQSSKFEVVAEDGNRSDFLYYVANDASDQHPAIIFVRSSGTVATKTPVINGMDVGGVYGEGYDGATFRELGKILFESAKLATSGDASGRITFWTRDATVADVERMRITETGLVGIGTVVPARQLDINSATGGCLQLTYNDNNGSAANKVTMDVSSSGSLIITPSGGSAAISGSLIINNLVANTTTGTKIGTATNQKIGFWSASPITQPVFATGAGHTVDDLITVLQNLGLVRQS